jgi:hypothetical protein
LYPFCVRARYYFVLQGQVRQYLLTARRSSFGQAPVGSRFNHHGLQNIAVIYLGKTVFLAGKAICIQWTLSIRLKLCSCLTLDFM